MLKARFQAGVGVRGKNVLVLDDASRTGSTLSSSAEALYLSGAKNVYTFTVARALPIMVYRTPERFVRSFSSQ